MMKKRIFCLILVLAAVIGSVSIARAQGGGYTLIAANADLDLYTDLYDQSGTPYPVNTGEILYCDGTMQYANGYYWYRVRSGGASVYICERYATVYDGVSSAYLLADCNVSPAAGTGHGYTCRIPLGQTVSITDLAFDISGDLWLWIEWNVYCGYIPAVNLTPVGWQPSPSREVWATLSEKNMGTRSGPSTKYFATDTFYSKGDKVKCYSRVYDQVNSIWWVQAEVDTGKYKRRVYTGSWRFGDLDVYSLPEERSIRNAWMNTSCTLRYGPGYDYNAYNASVGSYVQVSVFAEENGWCQIDCTVNSVHYRAWVPQSALS